MAILLAALIYKERIAGGAALMLSGLLLVTKRQGERPAVKGGKPPASWLSRDGWR